MDRYLVESLHSPEKCLHVLEEVEAIGYITHYDWGCESGVHCGWVIIEAENEEEALLSVPTFIRHKARAIKLNRFSPVNFGKYHEKAI